jgi:hypothetical protein
MYLARKQQNSCTGNVLKEFSTQSFIGFTISFTQFFVQLEFFTGASWDLDVEFSVHFDQISVWHLHVSVQNAMEIARSKLSQLPQLPVLLRSEVGK